MHDDVNRGDQLLRANTGPPMGKITTQFGRFPIESGRIRQAYHNNIGINLP